MSSADLIRTMKAINTADISSDLALGQVAAYKINDELAGIADGLSNSAELGLQNDRLWSEMDILELPELLDGLYAGLKNRLMAIMTSDLHVTNQMAKAAGQGMKEQLIKQEIKRFQESVVAKLKRKIEARAEKRNALAAQAQLQRMQGTSFGASEQDSEEKQQSMAQIDFSHVVHPDDTISVA